MTSNITQAEQEAFDAGVQAGREQMRPDPSKLTPQEVDMLASLSRRGFAVCIFTPDELKDADPDTVEERTISAGWDAIGGPWE